MSAFNDLLEVAKLNLIEEFSSINTVKTSIYANEKVTGYIKGAQLRSIANYPITKSNNIVVKFPGKSAETELLLSHLT